MLTHNLSPISVIFVSVYSMFCFAPSFSGQIARANLQMEKLSMFLTRCIKSCFSYSIFNFIIFSSQECGGHKVAARLLTHFYKALCGGGNSIAQKDHLKF